MYKKPVILQIMLVLLIVFSPIIASAANQQSSSNRSQGFIFELNDSLVNSTISRYPFFALDGYAPWCEPCKEMNATLYLLSSELNGQIAFGTVDIENNTKTAQRYNITKYPTLLIFKNGTYIDRRGGFGTESEIVDTLKRWMPGLNTSQLIL